MAGRDGDVSLMMEDSMDAPPSVGSGDTPTPSPSMPTPVSTVKKVCVAHEKKILNLLVDNNYFHGKSVLEDRQIFFFQISDQINIFFTPFKFYAIFSGSSRNIFEIIIYNFCLFFITDKYVKVS